MRGRIGRPGLVGTMARTAVIAGTATAVSGNMQRRQMGKAQDAQDAQYAEQQLAAQQQQAAIDQAVAQATAQQAAQQAAAAPPPAAAPQADVIAQLTQLGDLKAAGILDDAEFAAAKAKILG
jgi:hypothetical protein